MSAPRPRLSRDELDLEAGTLLPAKEVMSLLDLNVDADLALALAAPIDLAVAANANAALPIDAAVSANVLSALSSATGLANQEVLIDQVISGEAVATAPQDASIDQPDAGDAAAAEPAATDAVTTPTAVDGAAIVDDAVTAADPLAGSLEGGLLNVDVDVALDADLAAPIAGAVAANANVAAPIDAAVAANIGSIGSDATAVADQTAIITQHLDDVTAEATADQQADITQ